MTDQMWCATPMLMADDAIAHSPGPIWVNRRSFAFHYLQSDRGYEVMRLTQRRALLRPPEKTDVQP
jgi:hypothetical protein